MLVAALLAGLLAGCSSSSSASPATTTNDLPSLVLIGDSITHRSADVLTAALSDRYNVTVVAEDGRTIAEQQDGASQAAESAPEYVVINLGTNDAVKGVSLAD
ncbi:MAG: SGNH/GDSL hydrolase family protein, partial [Acidimicrobiales bacterium]